MCVFNFAMNTYYSLNDSELLDLVKSNDRAAFTEIYNRYWEKMVMVAFVKLQSDFDAEEVVQDLFIDIWERRAGIQIRNSFHTYISGALKYKIYTFIAKRKRERNKLAQLNFADTCNNTEEWLSYEALRDDLEKAVLELPEKCRLVFRLSREGGFSNREIAETLQVSKKAIEKHLTKALSHLHLTLKTFSLLLF